MIYFLKFGERSEIFGVSGQDPMETVEAELSFLIPEIVQ